MKDFVKDYDERHQSLSSPYDLPEFSRIPNNVQSTEKRCEYDQRLVVEQKMERTLIISSHIMRAKRGFVALRNQEGRLFCQKKIGFNLSDPEDQLHLRIVENILGNITISPGPEFQKNLYDFKPTTKSICVPLKFERETLGCIYLDYDAKNKNISGDEWELLEILGEQTVKAILAARNHQKKIPHKNFKCALRQAQNIIIESENMIRLYQQIRDIAQINVPILVLGEPGTGKELIARALHYFSKRTGQFMALNCSAIPEGIFESELFGSVKGAFHNAPDKPGKIELADDGTLFLDEIGDMDISLQPKLLRFLEHKKITRLGDTQIRKINTRIVAATNQDLHTMMDSKQFRPDLYQRLACFKIVIPPLRDRKDDIPALSHFFLSKFAMENGWKTPRISDNALNILKKYYWPGNIRELLNVMLRLSVNVRGRTIYPKHLMEACEHMTQNCLCEKDPFPTISDIERQHIQRALGITRQNISEAARMLGIARSTLHQKIKKYNLLFNKIPSAL